MSRAWQWDGTDEDVEGMLADVPGLLYELGVALVRDTSFVQHGQFRDNPPREDGGLEFDLRASQARDGLLRAFWKQGVGSGLAAAMRHALKVIDRPKDITYLGYCPNDSHPRYEMWGDRDTKEVRCGECEYVAPADEHRRSMLRRSGHVLLTAEEAQMAFNLSRGTMRQLLDGVVPEVRSTPYFDEHGTLTAGVELLYRVGDVTERVRQHEAEKAGMTSNEVAKHLGVKSSYIKVLVNRGKLVPIRPGAKPLRFTHDEVDRFIKERSKA